MNNITIRNHYDILRNKLRNAAGFLAEWESVTHIVRPQRRTGGEPAPVA